MSGGVDSSVAAGILLEQGNEVEGVSLRLWEPGLKGPRNCSDDRGAKTVADLLGIRHTVLDLRSEFGEAVVRPFARSYLSGLTPNPCVECNRGFKLGHLLRWARARGADYVATGHYARVAYDGVTGRASLFRGIHREKDQTYFLFALSQEQLCHTLFPLGHLRKDEVRLEAHRLGLPVAERTESQDICFEDYPGLVEGFAGKGDLDGGEIVDRAGKVLGRHQGIHRLTVGQRRGLGISSPHPLYVLEIDPEKKRVVVGSREELGSEGFVAQAVNWIERLEQTETPAEVQLRYRSRPVPCLVRAGVRGENQVAVEFRGVTSAVTPGQAAVFYRGDRVLGGGWIVEEIRQPWG